MISAKAPGSICTFSLSQIILPHLRHHGLVGSVYLSRRNNRSQKKHLIRFPCAENFLRLRTSPIPSRFQLPHFCLLAFQGPDFIFNVSHYVENGVSRELYRLRRVKVVVHLFQARFPRDEAILPFSVGRRCQSLLDGHSILLVHTYAFGGRKISKSDSATLLRVIS
jgi:hypothetical protein